MLTKKLMKKSVNFAMSFIENEDEKVFLHTGLPNAKIFDALLKLLTSVPIKYYAGWSVISVPLREQLLMTMMKLKMNLRHFDLAQRFGVSISTVSNIITTWLLLMHEILVIQLMKNIPSREENQRCLPMVFQHLSNCRIILDACEIFCDKPNLMLKQNAA